MNEHNRYLIQNVADGNDFTGDTFQAFAQVLLDLDEWRVAL